MESTLKTVSVFSFPDGDQKWKKGEKINLHVQMRWIFFPIRKMFHFPSKSLLALKGLGQSVSKSNFFPSVNIMDTCDATGLNICSVQIKDIFFFVFLTKGFNKVGNPEIEMVEGAPGVIFFRAQSFLNFYLFKAEKLF